MTVSAEDIYKYTITALFSAAVAWRIAYNKGYRKGINSMYNYFKETAANGSERLNAESKKTIDDLLTKAKVFVAENNSFFQMFYHTF